jgi:hypothetical protein
MCRGIMVKDSGNLQEPCLILVCKWSVPRELGLPCTTELWIAKEQSIRTDRDEAAVSVRGPRKMHSRAT